MREIEIKNLVQSQSVKENILKVLDIDDFDYEFVPEDQYPNGLYADFTIKKGNNVKAILELKGSDIGVTDYVRGIGQIMQYQHFADNNMSLKNYHFDNAIAVYLLPSSVIQRDSFNIGLFKYPEKSKIIEINEYNKNVRLITDKELQSLASTYRENNVAISQYYIRDNRLIELYLLLRFCQIKNLLGIK
ncbi:hypothetical protein IJJ97_07055, partial [bacterium]|nr:hypothetical protein [bacterium]